MRTLLASLLLLGSAALFMQGAVGQEKKEADKKEVTLKGKITCGKCELDVTPDCATVIVVKDKDKKDIVYYFDKKGHDKYHDGVCGGGKDGTVTGVVSDDGKKKTITVKEVKYK